MENQIEVFEQMMMDYLKGKLKPEDKPRFIMLLNSNEEIIVSIANNISKINETVGNLFFKITAPFGNRIMFP